MTDVDNGQSGVIPTGDVYLVELYPLDRTSSPPTIQPLYLSTRSVYFHASDPYAPSIEYDGRVTQALSYSRELWRDGLIGGGSIPSYGAITIGVDDDFVDEGSLAAWRGYAWDGRQVRILRGMEGDEYADYEVLLDGLLSGEGNTFAATQISLGLSDLTARLDQPVHSTRYAGTGGFEGTADLAGVDKPWSVGMFRGVEPVQVGDPADLWYDVDPINQLDPSVVPVIEDGGVPYAITGSNPPGGGNAYVDYGAGRIRLGTAPTSVLTVAAKSAAGAIGSPMFGVQTAADIIEHVLGLVGVTDLDTAAFAALNTANSNICGRWYREAPTAAEVIDLAINSVNGYYTTARGGSITVGVWSAPTVTAEDDADVVFVVTDADIVEGSLVVEPVGVPPNEVQVGYAYSHTVLDTGQFNGAATEARRAFLGHPYRYSITQSATVAAEHLLSDPLIRDTMLDDSTGGDAVAAEAAGLYAVTGRERIRFSLQLRPFAIEPASQIWVRSALNDIEAGYRVTSISDDAANPVVEIAAWR